MKMKHVFRLFLIAVLFLTGCSETQQETTPVAAPIINSGPGSGSILVPPTLSPSEMPRVPDQAQDVTVTLRNSSSWKVCYVYITSPDDSTWGDDWLERDEELKGDMTRTFTLPTGLYDLRAENCDYMKLDEQYDVSIDAPWTWEVSDPALLYEEYFDSIPSLKVNGAGASSNTSDEAYRLRATQPGVLALARPGQNFNNMVVTVEATPVAPADVSQVAYGVMCRVQTNGDGYVFLVRGDGWFSIQQASGGKLSPLADWLASEYVNSGSEINVIEAYCNAEVLSLRVNGTTVLEIEDTTYTQGDVALVVFGLGEVEFDNWIVAEP
jgi:hypothetical protein